MLRTKETEREPSTASRSFKDTIIEQTCLCHVALIVSKNSFRAIVQNNYSQVQSSYRAQQQLMLIGPVRV